MNDLNNFLSEGFNYERTHQIFLKILLQDSLFLKYLCESSGIENISNPIVELEPEFEGTKFDIGVRSKDSTYKEQSILIELKMWASTGKDQLEKQIEVANKNDVTLIYIVIGYPDRKLEDQNKINKNRNEYTYLDTPKLIELLESFTNIPFVKTYTLVLKNKLFNSHLNTNDKSLSFFYSLQSSFMDMVKGKIGSVYHSNARGGGKDLRCYFKMENPISYKEGNFDLYLFLFNNKIKLELFDYQRNDKIKRKEIIEKISNVIPEEWKDSISISGRKYFKILERSIEFKSNEDIKIIVNDFLKLHQILISFQSSFKNHS